MNPTQKSILFYNSKQPISSKLALILEKILPMFSMRIMGLDLPLSIQSMEEISDNKSRTILLVSSDDLNDTSIKQMLLKNNNASIIFIKYNDVIIDQSHFTNSIKCILDLTNINLSNLDKENLPQEIIRQLVDFIYNYSSTLSDTLINTKKQTIFVAETSTDQEKSRQELIRELIDFGYNVVPQNKISATNYKEEIQKEILKSDLFIHLIGNDYGTIPIGSNVGFIELQHQLVNAFILQQQNESNHLCRYIWITPSYKPSSKEQSLFVSNLQQDSDLLKQTEIIQTPLEKFKSIIIDRLKEDEVIKKATSNTNNNQRKIYHIYDKHDEKLLGSIHHQLQKSGFEVLHIEKSTTQNLLDMHRNFLAVCDAVLVNYSGSNEQWLSSKLKDVVKAPGYGRKKPYSGVGLILNNTTKFNPVRYVRDIIIIQQENNFDPSLLDSFLQKTNKK